MDLNKKYEKDIEDLQIANSFVEQKLLDTKKDIEEKMQNINEVREEERRTLKDSQNRYESIHSDYRDISNKFATIQLEVDNLEAAATQHEIKYRNLYSNCEILTS